MCPAALACLVVLLLGAVGLGHASWGDTSHEYRECKEYCIKKNCSTEADMDKWESRQPLADYLIGLGCDDDCTYDCMWITTQIMKRRFKQVPQFFGRWPFVRFLGIQEPASTLFSVLNLATNLYMLLWFIQRVPSTAPMYNVWLFYALICLNAWFWSTVFHTRDVAFTEMMDYFCAFSVVLFSLLAFMLRCLVTASVSNSNSLLKFLISSSAVAFYLHHVIAMATVKFDYGYNMKVNMVVGGLNCACWILWLLLNWRLGLHIRKGLLAVVGLGLSASLELLDFPPIFWVFDSHALWHLATAPLPLLWYQFGAEDCLYLHSQEKVVGKKRV